MCNVTKSAGQRFPLHDHAGASAIGAVVHVVVAVSAVLPGIVEAALYKPCFAGAAHEGCGQGRGKKFWEEGDNVKMRHGGRVS